MVDECNIVKEMKKILNIGIKNNKVETHTQQLEFVDFRPDRVRLLRDAGSDEDVSCVE